MIATLSEGTIDSGWNGTADSVWTFVTVTYSSGGTATGERPAVIRISGRATTGPTAPNLADVELPWIEPLPRKLKAWAKLRLSVPWPWPWERRHSPLQVARARPMLPRPPSKRRGRAPGAATAWRCRRP